MIQLARKHAGHLSRLLSKLIFSLLNGAVRLILNLRLSLFFVPFRGLVKFLNYPVLQVTDFPLELRQVAPDDRLRRFLQNLFHAPQVFPEAPERFSKGLIRRVANAILLQRQRCVQQRAPSCQAVDRLFGPRNVRLHHFLHLAVESRQCLPGGFFKRRSNAFVDFLDQRSRSAVQFVAVQVQHVVQLRLKSCESLLLRILELLCVVLDSLARFSGLLKCGFQALGLFLERLSQCGHALFGLQLCARRRLPDVRGMARHLLLQRGEQAACLLVQSAGSAILRLRECALDCGAPTHLRGFHFGCELRLPGRLRRCYRRFHMLPNLSGHATQRIALGRRGLLLLTQSFANGARCGIYPLLDFDCGAVQSITLHRSSLFSLPCCFLDGPCSFLRARSNLRLRLLRLCSQS